MPIYDYRCGCGRRFEVIQSLTAPDPGCPDCGGQSARVPSAPALGGRAAAGRSREYMPQTWRGTRGGNREHLTALRREWAARERLEAKHPELAGDTRPVLAHEGRYHGAPLRAGDPMPGPAAAGDAPGPGHAGGHSHSTRPGQSGRPGHSGGKGHAGGHSLSTGHSHSGAQGHSGGPGHSHDDASGARDIPST